MAPEFERSDYGGLLSDLEAVNAWLIRIGVRTEKTSLEQIIRNIDYLSKNYTTTEFQTRLAREGETWLRMSLLDAHSHIRIWRALQTLKSHKLPRARLKDTLMGAMPHDCETVDNAIGRNILFQLELAATMLLKGFRVLDFDDVLIDTGTPSIRFECKRAFGIDGVSGLVSKAAHQLGSRFDASGGERGVIAVSVDRMILGDYSERTFPDQKSAEKFVESKMDEFRLVCKRQIPPIVDTRVIGIAYYHRLLFSVAGLYSSWTQLDYQPLSTPEELVNSHLQSTLRGKLDA